MWRTSLSDFGVSADDNGGTPSGVPRRGGSDGELVVGAVAVSVVVAVSVAEVGAVESYGRLKITVVTSCDIFSCCYCLIR